MQIYKSLKSFSFNELALLFGPIILMLVFLLGKNLEANQQRFLAIFTTVIFYWLFTNIPLYIPGIIGVTLTIFAGIISPAEAFSQFSSPIIYLFWAGFIFANAMQKHGLDKRLALELLTLKSIRGSVTKTICMLFAITGFFTLWVSNTAVAAMMLPLVMAILHGLKLDHDIFETKILLGIAYMANIGGVATPIGSTPNIIALDFLDSVAGVKINFLNWILLSLPLALICMLSFTFYALKFLPKNKLSFNQQFLLSEKKSLSPLSHFEKNLSVLFFITIIGWFLPGTILPFLQTGTTLYTFFDKYADPGVIGMFMASMLFIFPLFSKNKIQDKDDLNKIDWGTLLLFGSGLALGKTLFSTGLANEISNFLLKDAQSMSVFVFFLCLSYFTIFFTEFTSNTAAANILLPIVIALCQKMNISPTGPCFIVAIACSLAFMFPISTPPNAIVYATGKIPLRTMAKLGFKMNIIIGFFMALYFYTINFFGIMP